MIRLKSVQDIMDLKDTIPTLAYIRGMQFLGSDGYNAEIDGWIVVLEQGDDPTQIEEIGDDGLFVDGLPTYEFVGSYLDGDVVCMEIVLALDSERTIAIIAEQSCFDADLLTALQKQSTPPQPLPTLNRRTP